MSHSNRPHNIGQVLLNALASAASSGQRAILQNVEQKRADTQQSFLNRLSQEAGGRSEERLGLERERLGLQRQRNEDALIGKTSPNPFFQEEPSALEQARTNKLIRETELLGTSGGGRSMFGVGTGNTIFDELNLGFKQREFGRMLERGDPSLQRRDFTGELVDIPFEDAQELISTPQDTLRVLLQQAKNITGETSSLNGLGQDSVFPDSTDFLPAEEIPESAKAQIGEGLRQRYGSEQWNSLTPEQKEAIIREQFFNPR